MNDPVSPHTLQTWLHDGAEIALFDVREYGHYGAEHLFYGTSLPYSRLELDITRLAPNRNVRLVVYDETGDDVAPRAVARLRALGYRQVWRLDGGCQGWRQAGRELFAGVNVPSKTFGELIEVQCHTPHLTAEALHERQACGEPLLLLDGRPFEEFRKMTIPGARCCPNGELAYRLGDLLTDETTPIVVNCAGRTRSIIGAQTLINLGVKNPVYALENGTQGWFLADLTLEHGANRRHTLGRSASGGRPLASAARQLAERAGVRWVDAAQVQAWAEEEGRSLFLCDVRTWEEFTAGSLPGAQHAPGGQLVQATDQYVGVRGARLVLLDDDDVRAATTASWLRQLGHEAYVLVGGLHRGLTLSVTPSVVPEFDVIDSVELAALGDAVAVIDLRPSAAFGQVRLALARWSIRPRLVADLAAETRPLVVVATDPGIAQLALAELPTPQRAQARVLLEGPAAWTAAGLTVHEDGDPLTEAERSDFLFFTHGRHDGDKAASRQYLAWELGLLDELGEAERGAFRPLVTEAPR